MSPAQGVIVLTTALILSALLLLGRQEDRRAAFVLVALVLLEPLAQPLQIGTWRAGLFVLNLAGLLALWRLSERTDRWWIFITGALQSTVVWSHLLPLLSPGQFNWTLATLRLGLWVLMLAVMAAQVVTLLRPPRRPAHSAGAAASERRPAASIRRR